MKQPVSIEQLKKILGLSFKNPALLEAAVVHSSLRNEYERTDLEHYDRLEFFGDTVLNFVISKELFKRYPEHNEGALSRIRAVLVSRKILARIAKPLKLWDAVRLGKGMRGQTGPSRDKVLADTFEALIAALYLDRGMRVAEAFILEQFGDYFNETRLRRLHTNPKSTLQELSQRHWKKLPVYNNRLDRKGDMHCKISIHSKLTGTGAGKNKRQAEERAAKVLISKIRKQLAQRPRKSSSRGKLRKT